MSDSEKPKSWRECRKTITHRWHVPVVFIEWICWQVSPFLEQLAFLKVLEHLGRLAVLIAVVFYFTESGSRRKAKHYQAWQVTNYAQGKPGSGGRIDALQDLHKDGISLAGVDISKAYLPELHLENADLSGANLVGAFLDGANLAGAVLDGANLVGASLDGANLAGASLDDANLARPDLLDANLTQTRLARVNLIGADLSLANLTGAFLWQANLAGADLSHANLTGAFLTKANLAGAFLRKANLAGAYLKEANLTKIEDWQEITSIENANIYNVKNPPDGFIEWATEHGAVSCRDVEEWEKLMQEKIQEQTKQK